MTHPLSDGDIQRLYLTAGEVYRPSAPITQRDLFAGRLDQLSALVDALGTAGQHAVVYGERGVGKTSLVSILPALAWKPELVPTHRHNCHRGDTFGRIWRRALEGVRFEVERPAVGFSSEVVREVITLTERIQSEPTPDQVVTALRSIAVPLVFIFDEFDQVQDPSISVAMAEVMKALSDYAAPTKIVLVGVGDTVDSLIASHASVERAARQIRMPRMYPSELAQIIDKASAVLGMHCEPAARDRIVRLSQGLPHYVHALGLFATRAALQDRVRVVDLPVVERGIAKSMESASQSLLDAYLKAISSPQKDSLYKNVLLACALSKTDEMSFFTPAAVRTPLRKMGRNLEIPAFASHLNKFASSDRGNVLQKVGTSRRFRYRFSNPLLQPFVVMRGVVDGLVTPDSVDDLLCANAGALAGQLPLVPRATSDFS